MIANIYFVNDLIKKVSISSTDKKDFKILHYQITDEKLKKYFGPPKKAKNNNTIWKFNKIKVRHYFLDIDGYPIEYLTLENSF